MGMIIFGAIGWVLFFLLLLEYRFKKKQLFQIVEEFKKDAFFYYRQRRELEVRLYGHDYVHLEYQSKDPRWMTIKPNNPVGNLI